MWVGCFSLLWQWACGQDPENERGFPRPRGSSLASGETRVGVVLETQLSAGTMRSGARGSRVQRSGKMRSPRGPGAWKVKSRSSERPS